MNELKIKVEQGTSSGSRKLILVKILSGKLTVEDVERAINSHQSLVDGLKFYADEENYDDNCAPFYMETSHECVHEYQVSDLGKTAKEILNTVLT